MNLEKLSIETNIALNFITAIKKSRMSLFWAKSHGILILKLEDTLNCKTQKILFKKRKQ